VTQTDIRDSPHFSALTIAVKTGARFSASETVAQLAQVTEDEEDAEPGAPLGASPQAGPPPKPEMVVTTPELEFSPRRFRKSFLTSVSSRAEEAKRATMAKGRWSVQNRQN
jgi:hypothetical protein